MPLDRFHKILVLPAVLVFAPLVIGPLLLLFQESLRPYEGGRIGGTLNADLTFSNYTEFLHPTYAKYFLDTFRVSLIVTLLALVLGYLLAHYVVRVARPRIAKLILAGLLGVLFISLIVRIYAITITFGPVGPLRDISWLVGIDPRTRRHTELMVIFGLLHTVLPLVTLTMIGTIQMVNPRLEEAAMSLGAPGWRAFFSVTLPLCVPGIVSAGIIGYAFSISNLVVPLLMGRGFVTFISNLIYFRFSEVGNFPSGAALSVIMLVIALSIFFAGTRIVSAIWPPAERSGR